MKVVQEGKKVKIRYEAKLEDGTVCLTTEKEGPIELVVGEGKFLIAIEQVLPGMKEGETKTIVLDALDTFGPHLDDLLLEVPRELFPDDVILEIGARVKIDTPSERSYVGTVININEKTLTLDLNHPLAGKTLVCAITVVSIE